MTVSEQFNTPKKIQKKLGYELLSELGRPKHQFSKERAFALIKAGADLRVREAILDRNNACRLRRRRGIRNAWSFSSGMVRRLMSQIETTIHRWRWL